MMKAVSYTHLLSAAISLAAIGGVLGLILAFASQKLSIEAVSYTHLDVYKRQPLGILKGTGNLSLLPSVLSLIHILDMLSSN